MVRSQAFLLKAQCHNNQISVVIEPGASPIHARMRAALANLDMKATLPKAISLIASGESGPIHMAACGAASRDYVFDGPEF
jgi:hypothetical protein